MGAKLFVQLLTHEREYTKINFYVHCFERVPLLVYPILPRYILHTENRHTKLDQQ